MTDYIIEGATTTTLDAAPAHQNGTAPTKTIHVLVTPDRADKIKMRIMRKVETDLDAQLSFIAHFLADARGMYLPEADAMELIDDMNMSEVKPLIERVTKDLQEVSAGKK